MGEVRQLASVDPGAEPTERFGEADPSGQQLGAQDGDAMVGPGKT